MGKLLLTLVVIAAAVIGGGYFNRTQCLSDEGPRAAVLGYVTAMKDKRFEDEDSACPKPLDDWAVGPRRSHLRHRLRCRSPTPPDARNAHTSPPLETAR